jgi:hypothetical protein
VCNESNGEFCLPGYVATDRKNHGGPGAAVGAIAIVNYAQTGDNGPTAGFFHKEPEHCTLRHQTISTNDY